MCISVSLCVCVCVCVQCFQMNIVFDDCEDGGRKINKKIKKEDRNKTGSEASETIRCTILS